MSTITSVAELEAVYGEPAEAAVVKVADRVTEAYRRLIGASPFAALATVGPEGVDCSPRGDRAGFVRISEDGRVVMMPDRRGNNRIDSLRNIVRDPRVALLFLIPGVGHTVRVNGRARLEVDEGLCGSFAVEGKSPRCVIVIDVEAVYFQCARAIVRSGLWDSSRHVEPGSVPTRGEILAGMSAGRVGGAAYDAGWAERARRTMW
jgi:PPOX class probable FMN-dependent enzyme